MMSKATKDRTRQACHASAAQRRGSSAQASPKPVPPGPCRPFWRCDGQSFGFPAEYCVRNVDAVRHVPGGCQGWLGLEIAWDLKWLGLAVTPTDRADGVPSACTPQS